MKINLNPAAVFGVMFLAFVMVEFLFEFGGAIFLGFMTLSVGASIAIYFGERRPRINQQEIVQSCLNQEGNPSFRQILIRSVIITLIMLLLYSFFINLLRSKFGIKHGPFGDAYGALNAIAAFLGFTMISFSIFYQRKDFNTQIKHIEDSNKQFQEHSRQLDRQSNLMEIDLQNNIAAVMPYFKFSVYEVLSNQVVPGYAEMGKMVELRMDNHGGIASGVEILQPTYFVGNKRENICICGEIDGIISPKGLDNVVRLYSGSDTEQGSSFVLDPEESSELNIDDFLFVIICKDLYLKQHIFNFKLNLKTRKTVLCDLTDKLFLCFHATPINQSPVN